jgi:hypothetical protein
MSFTSNTIAEDSVCSAQETNFASTDADALVYRNGAGTVFDGTGVNVGSTSGTVIVENWYLTGGGSARRAASGDAAARFGDPLALTGFDALTLILFGGVLLLGGTAFIAYGELRRRRRA